VTAIYAIECHHGLGRSLSGWGLFSTLVSIALIALQRRPLGAPVGLGPQEGPPSGPGAPNSPQEGLWAALGICAAIFLYAIVSGDSRPRTSTARRKRSPTFLLHLQLLHRRDDSGARCLALSLPFDPVLQLPALRRRADGPGAGPPDRRPRTTSAFCLLIALGGNRLLRRRVHGRAQGLGPGAGHRDSSFGGMGMTLLVHLTDTERLPWTSMRFIGSAPMDKPRSARGSRPTRQVRTPGASRGALLVLHLPGRLPSPALRLLPPGTVRDGDAPLGAPAAIQVRGRSRDARSPGPARQHLGLPLQGSASAPGWAPTGGTGGASCPPSRPAPRRSGFCLGVPVGLHRSAAGTGRPCGWCPGRSTRRRFCSTVHAPDDCA
jgi:hypothetical protein